jgi:hypothetical protein
MMAWKKQLYGIYKANRVSKPNTFLKEAAFPNYAKNKRARKLIG